MNEATRALSVVEDHRRLATVERDEARAEILRAELRRLEAGDREPRGVEELIRSDDD
ncbi:MAG: hypothetical protein LC774_10020 [Acidobacteria bacterium]|nr:hypothetical protein [Acidobacteriota bacterium]